MGTINTGLGANQEPEQPPDITSEKTNSDVPNNLGLDESQDNSQNENPPKNPEGNSTKGTRKTPDNDIPVRDRNGNLPRGNGRLTVPPGTESPASSRRSSDDDNVFMKTIFAILGTDSSSDPKNNTEKKTKRSPELNKTPRSPNCVSNKQIDKTDKSKDGIQPVPHNPLGRRITLDTLNVPAYPSNRRWSNSSAGSPSTKTSPNIHSNRNRELGHRWIMRKSCTSPSLARGNLKVPRSPGNSSSSFDGGKPRFAKNVSIDAEVNQTSTNRRNWPGDQSLTSRPRLTSDTLVNGPRLRLMTTGHIQEEPTQERFPPGISRPRLMTTGGMEGNSRNGPTMSRSNTSTRLEEGQITAIELPTARRGFIGDIGFTFGGANPDETDNPDDWEALPILVEHVIRGSIADKAGLEIGDEIIKINGVSVRNAARSVAVALIRNSQKKILILVKKGKGGKRKEERVFSEDQLLEFHDAFSIYDRTNKGKIHVDDVPRACRLLGFNETALDIDNAINAAKVITGEHDNSDKVRYDTFLEILKEFGKFQDFEEDVKFAYAAFDPEHKGRFNVRLLRDAFLAGAKRITTLEMTEIFRMADPDRDERVCEKEFRELLYPYIEMY